MSQKPSSEIEERIFTFEDVKALFQKKKLLLLQVVVYFWVALFGFCLIRPSKYEINASFKEGVESEKGGGGYLKELISGAGLSQSQPQAAAFMKSFSVLRPLIEKLGLQANIPTRGVFSKVYSRLKDSIDAQKGRLLDERDEFSFKEVVYEGENALSLVLRFDDFEHFLVLDAQKEVIAHGILGQEVILPDAQFVLEKTPQNLRYHRNYPLTIQPWIPIAASLKGELKIKNHKTNEMIYDLSIFQRDRRLGVKLLNGVMQEYKNYLKKEHDLVSKEQLKYLNQKYDEIYSKVGLLLNEHANYLSENLQAKGFAVIEKEIYNLLRPHQEMAAKVFAIDVELARLSHFEDKSGWAVSSLEGPLGSSLHAISSSIQDLKKERDLFELSLQRKTPSLNLEETADQRKKELDFIRKRQIVSEKLLKAVSSENKIDFSLQFDLEKSLASWANRIETVDEKEDFESYLENHIRLLSLSEKMLQERAFYGQDQASELEGIDLETARSLFVEYNHKLDRSEALMCHFLRLKEEIQNKHFDISSLSSILTDPVSQTLIQEAAQLSLKLKDEKHHSEREGKRWEEEIELQKRILKDHLDQLCKVEKLNAGLTRDKIRSLQSLSLESINRRISVLNEQAKDSIKERKEALLEEKGLLKLKMEELRASLSHFPEKWRKEKWMDLKTDIGKRVIQALTEIVESKTISHHMHHVESKPLDFATLPLSPNHPHLFLFPSLGAFFAAFSLFFFFFLQTVLKGFPSSFSKLEVLGYPLSGELSFFCDGKKADLLSGTDLETIRRLIFFLEKQEGKIVSILSGKGPDYSYALAKNLKKRSLKSLIVRCDFSVKYQEEETVGLVQFLEEKIKTAPIQKIEGIDTIFSGGFTPFSVEYIQSKSFEKLLLSLKEKYDFIFLFFKAPLDTTESIAALKFTDKAIVSVQGEPTEMLTPFIDWAYHERDHRINFIVAKSP